jgi:predicted Zn-dependent protease
MRATFISRGLPGLLALTLTLAPLARAQAPVAPIVRSDLPALGDSGEMSLGEERRLGDRIARNIYRDPDYLDDPALSAYLQALWRPLLASARARGDISPEQADRFAWDIMLARDSTINAFALPGGYLGVHLGLIGSVASADELASVLAHELSHVSQRHISRLLSKQSQQSPWLMAAMILGALAASRSGNADVAHAAIVGGQAVAQQSRLNFSRDMEREADRVGFGVMTEAGFAGEGFASMFDKLQQASRLNDDGSFPYLRSHPLTTERVADMRARVQLEHAHPHTAASPVSATYHAMMAARARVLAETAVDRLQALARSGQSAARSPLRDPAHIGQRYAGVLAAAQLRDGPLALDTLASLLATVPQDSPSHQSADWLALETLMLLKREQGPGGLTLAALRDRALASNEREGVLLGARAALDGDAAIRQSAIQRLRAWVTQNTSDALAWQTLAALHGAQQQPVQAARAEAEARLAQMDAPAALERLRAAQQWARGNPNIDHIELSILDARARYVDNLVREQLQDEKTAGN